MGEPGLTDETDTRRDARAQPKIGLLFGGRSAEHDVSKLSAANVLRALVSDGCDVVPIGIGRDGRWRLCGGDVPPEATSLEIPGDAPLVALVPGGGGEVAFLGGDARTLKLDVVFPVLHGPDGEDGTVQGLLELADVAFVGSGVLGSAVAMDKDVAKRLLREAALPVVPGLAMDRRDRRDFDEVAATLGTGDLFVKPANMGSSVGVSHAAGREAYEQACELAFRYDTKILVEAAVPGAREIECAVLETAEGELQASPLGEILPSAAHGFYSYDSKYLDPDGALLRIPADLPSALSDRIRGLATAAFRALACEGMARVDFLLHPERDDEIYLNELNTLPGFTAISMYPKLWEQDGLPQPKLMRALVAHALARHDRRAGLETTRAPA